MLIRCKQSRRYTTPSGAPLYGSTIDLTPKGAKEKKVYNFKPLNASHPDEDHVCEVTDQADIAKLLAIPEGFEIHSSEHGRRAVPKAVAWPATETSALELGAAARQVGEEKLVDVNAHMSRDELLKVVAKKTGQKPNPATSRKRLLELLAAA